MDYDVLVLGGGIIGCAIAYELSKYNLNIAIIEKDYDIADDVALINTATIYDGSECDDTLTAKLERMGNNMLDTLTSKFNIPFKRCGSLILAENDEQAINLQRIYDRAINRGIKDLVLLDENSIYDIEPNIKITAKKALYSKKTGIISPYDLALSYGEIAFDNGVKFKLEEEVVDIQRLSKGFKVITNKNKFTCQMVINTTSGVHYSIDDTKEINKEKNENNNNTLKYFLLENENKKSFLNVLFLNDISGDKIYGLSSMNGDIIGAMSTNKELKYDEVIEKISSITGEIKPKQIKMFLELPYHNEPIVIDDSSIDEGYIKIKGKHYGVVTMTPAIASIVCETVVSNINCKLKKDFNDNRREYYRFRDLSNEERQSIIELDKKYGKIICVCEKVTEGEIVDAIRRPLGARTVEGIKRRTGSCFGSCQGAHCLPKIVSILARETNKNITDIVKDSKHSKMILSRIKEFDSM